MINPTVKSTYLEMLKDRINFGRDSIQRARFKADGLSYRSLSLGPAG